MKLKSFNNVFTVTKTSDEKNVEKSTNGKESGQVHLMKYENLETTSDGRKLKQFNRCNESDGNFPQSVIELQNKTTNPSVFISKQKPPQRPYPKKVFFIIGNEFCERFSYYGLRTILVLYLRNVLGFSDSKSTIFYHLFAALCYIMPIFGAICADSIWGKFKTIVYLSIVYIIGEFILVISSVFWDNNQLSSTLTFIALILIGAGTGGIKPCVPPFGGDQFLADEEKWRQSFFSLFYWVVNIACLLGMFLAPMFRSFFQCVGRSDCYPIAFSIPCSLTVLALISFVVAKNVYVINPLPEENVVLAFCKCIGIAMKRKLKGEPRGRVVEILNGGENNDQKLDKVTLEVDINNREKSWLYLASDKFSEENIQNFKRVLHTFSLLIPIPIFYCIHDQQASLWILQANRMEGRVFNTGFILEPDQIIVANPLFVLIAIPTLEFIVYPFLTKQNWFVRPIQRMTFGGMLAAAAFLTSSLIEFHIQQSMPRTQPLDGEFNLLLVNGFNRCSIVSPTITSSNYEAFLLDSNQYVTTEPICSEIDPLNSCSTNLLTPNTTLINNYYQLNFKLAPRNTNSSFHIDETNCSNGNQNFQRNIYIKSLRIETTKLVYLEEKENGNLDYHLFNESLQLPEPGRARLRLLYASNGNSSASDINKFSLRRASSHQDTKDDEEFESIHVQFSGRTETSGKVSISEYYEVGLPSRGDKFILNFGGDKSIEWLNDNLISLKIGTRNLIIVQHDVKAHTFKINHQLLQDNDYYVSMLYQLIPHALLSTSEVLLAVTGISFVYSMAPETMKSVIFGAWYSTNAFGNILTVLLESTITFSNIANKFIFYAALMALDSMLLSYIGKSF